MADQNTARPRSRAGGRARPRRVLLLADTLGNGGAERQLTLLASHLPAGWRPQVWSLDGGPFVETLRSAGVPVRVRERAGRLDPRPAIELWRLLLTDRPDVVHSWGWMCSAAAAPVCRLLGIPFIDGTVRSGSLPARWTPGQRVGTRLAGRVTGNSRAGLRAWGVRPDRGRVVYNGFDPARLPLTQPPPDRPADPFTIVMTARMVPEKDYAALFSAARRLAARAPGWRFIALGDGPLRDQIMAEARDLVERGVVEFPAPRPEVLELVRRAHAGVLMTSVGVAEGLSNSIMEYMACGLPVVCSAAGGTRELVQDGVSGFLVPPSDGARLAERLAWLRANPAAARRMGDAGRRWLHDNLTVAKMVAGMVSVYEEVTCRRPSVRTRLV